MIRYFMYSVLCGKMNKKNVVAFRISQTPLQVWDDADASLTNTSAAKLLKNLNNNSLKIFFYRKLNKK